MKAADPTWEPVPLVAIGGPPFVAGWRCRVTAFGAYYRVPGGDVVIFSLARHEGLLWAHLSMSKPSRMPTWPELVAARDALLGDHVEAYQVAPPRDRYVNVHPRVLHLFACLDRPEGVLPPFHGDLGDGRLTI